ncbi:MAG: hypothetical protein NZM94_13195 [Roseiflexus sp.]|nr:hypothetical protein [Roseiflexus sp.]
MGRGAPVEAPLLPISGGWGVVDPDQVWLGHGAPVEAPPLPISGGWGVVDPDQVWLGHGAPCPNRRAPTAVPQLPCPNCL